MLLPLKIISEGIHREVGIHAKSFPKALRGAMRSDPDIVLIGEMRDNETIRLGLTCASMGMLVFGTLHTNNAPKTIHRIIDAFPANEQAQIQTMLAECLQAIVSQLLCRKLPKGRVAVHEILLWADGLPNTIRNGQIANIRTIIEGNKGRGMQSMDESIEALLDQGLNVIEYSNGKATLRIDLTQITDEWFKTEEPITAYTFLLIAVDSAAQVTVSAVTETENVQAEKLAGITLIQGGRRVIVKENGIY